MVPSCGQTQNDIFMSYARCDWSVTVFISGYANTVVTSQHILSLIL